MCAPPACIGPEEPRELCWSLHAGNQPQIENEPKLEAVPFYTSPLCLGSGLLCFGPKVRVHWLS